jgi:AcrR family transcriptional regulator
MATDKKGQRRAPRQDRAARTRASILEAAERLLSETPPAEVTTSALSREAGVPVGSVYRYFADARAVLFALFEEMNARTVEALTAARDRPAADWRDDLAGIAATVRGVHEAHPAYGALMRFAEPRGVEAGGPIAGLLEDQLRAARPDLTDSERRRCAGTVLAIFEAIEHRYHALPEEERGAAFAEGVRAVEAYLALWLDR